MLRDVEEGGCRVKPKAEEGYDVRSGLLPREQWRRCTNFKVMHIVTGTFLSLQKKLKEPFSCCKVERQKCCATSRSWEARLGLKNL